MKLYSTTGATAVTHDGVDYAADSDNAIDVPDELAAYLNSLFIDGGRAWENEGQREERLLAEQKAIVSSPEYLANLVAELSAKVASQSKPKATVKKATAASTDSAPVAE
jgi:hypothetical protein